MGHFANHVPFVNQANEKIFGRCFSSIFEVRTKDEIGCDTKLSFSARAVVGLVDSVNLKVVRIHAGQGVVAFRDCEVAVVGHTHSRQKSVTQVCWET